MRSERRGKFGKRKALLFALLLATLAFVSVGCASATTHYVPDGYAKIQWAIDNATAGDTIFVYNGTYYENINFNGKAITVKSEAGAENTVIDGGGIGSVVTFESGEGLDSVLDGFKITNAGRLNNHGIKCYQGSATIINNIIQDNAGWGICLYKSISVIRNNIIYGNPEFDTGPFDAVYSVESSPIIENNKILATDPNGNIDAIYIGDSEGRLPQSFLISSNIIKGRIWVSIWSPASTFENEISNNIIVIENVYSSAINSNIEDPARLLIANNVIANGGGIFLQRGGDRTRIINNIITESNQGIESWSGYFEILNNDLWNNTVNYIGIPDQTNIRGNICADPLFVDSAGGDYHLQAGSPCIDAGTNEGAPSTDFNGNHRPIDGDGDGIAIVDMGAFEHVPPGLWADINAELDALIVNVSAADMPYKIKLKLISELEYAKVLKDNAKEEYEDGNFEAATKKLGGAKKLMESFERRVKGTSRISPADKASFLAESAKIIEKIDELIEYIETEHKC